MRSGDRIVRSFRYRGLRAARFDALAARVLRKSPFAMQASPGRTLRTLADLSVGEAGVVAHVDLAGALSVRLQEMGFVENTSVRLIRRAPLGDPLQVEVRGYQVSVRRNEASLVHVLSPGGNQ